jgi:hypothetical protein
MDLCGKAAKNGNVPETCRKHEFRSIRSMMDSFDSAIAQRDG